MRCCDAFVWAKKPKDEGGDGDGAEPTDWLSSHGLCLLAVFGSESGSDADWDSDSDS